jgi:hypothetical protein
MIAVILQAWDFELYEQHKETGKDEDLPTLNEFLAI